MAITRIAAVQGSATANSSGEVSISLSGLTLLENDSLILALSTGDTNFNQDISASGNNSGAATEIADLFAPDNQPCNMWAGVSRQGPTVDATITVSGSTNGTRWAYIIVQYRGASSGIGSSATATGENSSSPNPPSLAPGETKIIAFYASGEASAWNTPSDVSNFLQQAIAGGRIAVADKDWISGTFDPAALTGSSESTSWAAATAALSPASQALTPSLFTNSQTFYAPTVTPGWVLTPSLFTNTQTFYAPIVQGPIQPSLFTNSHTFYAPTIIQEQFLEPALFTNSPSFPAPRVAHLQYLVPALMTNEQDFKGATAWADTQDSTPTWVPV